MLMTILVFILILGILIFVHEFGHFAVAKLLGIGVEEFGFGLPPRAFGKKIGETIYSINWLPIGGFVKLAGEDEIENEKLKIKNEKLARKLFWARSKKERVAVLLAGVSMNFLLAVVIISYIFTQGVLVTADRVHIEEILPNTPAEEAGLKPQDIILQIDGVAISDAAKLQDAVKNKSGDEITLFVQRGQQELTFNITPRSEYPKGEGPLGIAISTMEEKRFAWYQAPFFGLVEAVKMSYFMGRDLLLVLFKLVTFQAKQIDIAGPIGIAQFTSKAVKSGFQAVLELTGLLSLNLAILNILPIPALDGGRLMFVILEKFIGRKVKPQVEIIAHQIGMAFLFALLALVTINDILRIVRG